MLTEIYEGEVARLRDLQSRDAADLGHLALWLDQEIRQAEQRLAWFRELGKRVARTP